MLFGVAGALFAVTNTGFYTFAGWAAVFIAAIWLFRMPQKEADSKAEDNGSLATHLPICGGILVMLTAIVGTAGYLN